MTETWQMIQQKFCIIIITNKSTSIVFFPNNWQQYRVNFPFNRVRCKCLVSLPVWLVHNQHLHYWIMCPSEGIQSCAVKANFIERPVWIQMEPLFYSLYTLPSTFTRLCQLYLSKLGKCVEPSVISCFYCLVVLFLPEAHVIVARLNDNVEQQTIAGKKPGFDNRCGHGFPNVQWKLAVWRSKWVKTKQKKKPGLLLTTSACYVEMSVCR